MKTPHEQWSEFPQQEVRSAIQAGIDQVQPKVNHKHNSGLLIFTRKRMKKISYVVCSIAAVLIVLIGSSYYSPVLASSLSKIPLIGMVFGDSDLIGLQQAQKDGLTSQIGETQTVNGIAITLDEILYDENRITIGYVIQSEKDIGDHYLGTGMDFTINGKLPSVSSGGYNEMTQSSTLRTAIQDITVTEEMPDQFELGLILHGESGERWYFAAPIQKINNVYNIPILHTQHRDEVSLIVSRLSVSQAGVNIFYESRGQASSTEQSRAGDIEFQMTDQDGNEIKSHSGGVTGNKVGDQWVFKGSKQFDPIHSTVTEVTITPYIPASSGGGVELDGDGNSSKVLFQNEPVAPVKFDSFKVKIPMISLK